MGWDGGAWGGQPPCHPKAPRACPSMPLPSVLAFSLGVLAGSLGSPGRVNKTGFRRGSTGVSRWNCPGYKPTHRSVNVWVASCPKTKQNKTKIP